VIGTNSGAAGANILNVTAALASGSTTSIATAASSLGKGLNLAVAALLFPVGFIMLYLMGFDLVTGVFTLVPLAWLDKRPGVSWKALIRNWGLVFVGNFAGALVVPLIFAILPTKGFATAPDAVGDKHGQIGVSRTLAAGESGPQ